MMLGVQQLLIIDCAGLCNVIMLDSFFLYNYYYADFDHGLALKTLVTLLHTEPHG